MKDFYAKVWNFADWNLELYVQKQGTGDTTALPVLPYRDDGLPLWKAIRAFAGDYVNAWYERDAVVANDRQLEAFVQELNAPEGGNLAERGFPSAILTREDLAETVARLIWQAGPGHGGINYSQYQYFAPIANAAGSAYADYRTTGTLPKLMDVLPPIEQAITQGDIFNQLTQKVFGSLGQYNSDFTKGLNSDATAAVTRFQEGLKQCAADVAQRNRQASRHGRDYVWLDPTNLPNSTNI